jgi:hypothetical protein
MAKLNYEQLAVAALDALLAGGLEITQHYYEPDPNEWYFKGPMGNTGPFGTPEAAVKAAVHACRSASSPSRPLPPLRSARNSQRSAPGSSRPIVAMGSIRGDGPLTTQ